MDSRPIAETWFEHVNAARWRTQLQPRLREMLINRVALLNRVDHVIAQHVPKLALAEGVSLKECEALRDWRDSGLFDAAECAALAYADSMTRDVAVSDEVFAALRPHFNDQEIVELSRNFTAAPPRRARH
jgi:alkylhydroperoxidase family enzyme